MSSTTNRRSERGRSSSCSRADSSRLPHRRPRVRCRAEPARSPRGTERLRCRGPRRRPLHQGPPTLPLRVRNEPPRCLRSSPLRGRGIERILDGGPGEPSEWISHPWHLPSRRASRAHPGTIGTPGLPSSPGCRCDAAADGAMGVATNNSDMAFPYSLLALNPDDCGANKITGSPGTACRRTGPSMSTRLHVQSGCAPLAGNGVLTAPQCDVVGLINVGWSHQRLHVGSRRRRSSPAIHFGTCPSRRSRGCRRPYSR